MGRVREGNKTKGGRGSWQRAAREGPILMEIQESNEINRKRREGVGGSGEGGDEIKEESARESKRRNIEGTLTTLSAGDDVPRRAQ